MGLAETCCSSAASTRTYSRDKGEFFPCRPLTLDKSASVPLEPQLPHVSSPTLSHYKFPKFCKILGSVVIEDIRSIYKFEKRLGSGKFGVVNQVCLHKDPTQKFAVKSIPIEFIFSGLKLIENELDILTKVDHPSIIKYYETYNDGKHLHIVTELCTGGELFSHIQEKKMFNESEAARIMEKMLSGIAFLHEFGICHRDLKPENFMFSSNDPDAEIKIIDFGLSTNFVSDEMKEVVGTPFYVAPEVLEGVYTKACDVWSLGVILYILLSGKFPFFGASSSEVLSKVARGTVFFPEKSFHNISTLAKDLILKMLERNPLARYTAKQCLDHPWFQQNGDSSSPKLDIGLFKRLKNFRKVPRFKQEILGIIVKFLHPPEVKHFYNNFRAMDQNEDGYISVHDFIQTAKEQGMEMDEEEATKLVSVLDFDNNGYFSISDFVAASIDKSLCSEKMAKLAFDHFDVQKDGYITVLDLIQAFQPHFQGEHSLYKFL